MNKSLFIVAILFAGILSMMTAGSTVSYASNDNEEVNLSGGKLTIKKADDIVININGNTGPQGEVGPAGPQGETGPAGPQGEQGIQGIQGPAGKDGVNGTNGQDGVNGTDGAQGPAGQNGVNGQDGTTLSNETLNTISQLESQASTLATVYDLYQNGSLGNISLCYTQDNSTDCLPITPSENGTVVNPDNGTDTNATLPVEPPVIVNPPVDNGTNTNTTEPIEPPVINGTGDNGTVIVEPPIVIIPDNGTIIDNGGLNGTIDVPSNDTPTVIIDDDVNVTN